MIKEIAITPGFFEQSTQVNLEDWRDALLVLIRYFGPSETSKPIVISNLYDERWHKFACSIVPRIVDRKSRERCMQFLEIVRAYLVKRRSYSEVSLHGDLGWFHEALLASQDQCIDRIMTSEDTKKQLQGTYSKSIGFMDVLAELNIFDNGDDSSPPLDIKQQIDNLDKVLYYSDWLKLISPYGLSSEKDFTIQLIEAFAKRGCNKGIALHVREALQNSQGRSSHDSNDSAIESVRRKLKHLKNRINVSVSFESDLLDRYLLAGSYTSCKKEKLRWAIFLGHIAREYSEKRTEWKLLSCSRASELATKYTNLHLGQPMANDKTRKAIEII